MPPKVPDVIMEIIAQHADAIGDLFEQGVLVSVLVRLPGDEDVEMLITKEKDLTELIALIKRSQIRQLLP